MYGEAAWIEILSDQSVTWSGCWGKSIHIWVATQFGECVDLNTSVAYRRSPHSQPELKSIASPPMLWSKELPRFYQYKPQGVAELNLETQRDQQWLNVLKEELVEKCHPLDGEEPADTPEFPDEPIICPNRKVLDDGKQSFRHFDRTLSIVGIPPGPLSH